MERAQMATDEIPGFGVVLSRYRIAAGLTQEELAERAGLSVEAISTLERGVTQTPRPSTVRLLVDALQLSPDDRASVERAVSVRRAAPRTDDTLPEGSYLGARSGGELVGRDEELDRIQSVLDAVAQGMGQILLVNGEAGVGKTRLLQEIMVAARVRGYLVLTVRCSVSDRATPFFPFREALGALSTNAPPNARSEAQRGWKRVRRLLAEVSVDHSVTTSSIAMQEEVSSVVLDLFSSIAQSVPLAVLIDDLQWADGSSLKLLSYLAHSTRTASILLAGAFQDRRLSEDHAELAETLQTLSRERLAERITIRRLSLEETTRLVAVTMGEGAVSEEFAHFVYRRTKGIPRLVDGLIRSLGGRLQLEGEIGAGSKGRVFRAFDRTLEKTVAAKLVLARQEIDLDTLLRFQQEGAVLARLEHPNIVDIYDSFGEEHASCIIMELLDGRSLGRLLRDGPIPLVRAKHLAVQVADALSYAHSQSIVHRDIKPDNVMVLEGDQVKVTDFGIARILQPDTSLATIATTGMRMGTPAYMAPEQIEGKKVDGRTDIYALGAMLYHMVTRRPPFEGSDALAVAVKHLQEEPTPPSSINPAIPADWDALILKAMAKDPAKRFQSAEETKDALTALGESAVLPTPTALRPWRIAAAAAVIALAAAIFGGVWAHTAGGSQRMGPVSSIDAYLMHHHFSGYILLERHGRVLLSKGYGLADKKANIPNTIRSRWLDAGTNRFITAIAVLKLQDERKLSVQDRLCRYVSGCPRSWRPITIRDLLLDTSGLGTFDTSLSSGGVESALVRCKALPVGVPGAITSVSRCNNLLLNIIIVKVTGKPWATAMNDLVFGPAQMTGSGRLTNSVTPPTRVSVYSAGVPIRLGNYDNYFVPYSSIQDLERMDRALLSGRLLSKQSLHDLFTSYLSGGAVLNRYVGSNGSNATQLAGGYGSYLRQATRTTVTVADEPAIMSGFSLDNALSPDDGTIAIMAKNDESGPDPTDVIFGLAARLLWGKQTGAPPPTSTRGKKIAAYLTRARFNGYVYLGRHGQVILSQGFGMADAEDKVPNTPQTKWPAFAETRFLVGLAIMKLQEHGKLSVQDKICTYMRRCPTAWQPITVRQLLTNTSGMGSYDPFAPGVTLDQTMAACKLNPLVSPPGTPSPWSDCNTFLLDTIMEKLTGQSWSAAMHKLVFGPAGMTDTGRMTNALKPPERGRLYRAGSPSPELNYDGYNLAYTTVDDMIRLNHALLTGKILSKRSLRAMFTPLFHADPSDPSSPWTGYEVVIEPATVTTYQAVCVSCVNGGGEDDTGTHSGFFMTIQVSPDAGAMQIEFNNDSAYFDSGEDDNAFFSLIEQQLYGK